MKPYLITKNRKHRFWIGCREFIPGHWSISDWIYAIKRDIQVIWFHYIGKYKILDSTKYIERPNTTYFILSKKQEDIVKQYNVRYYQFAFTGIGIDTSIITTDGSKIDINDYDTW
jgi:hypothetical protein